MKILLYMTLIVTWCLGVAVSAKVYTLPECIELAKQTDRKLIESRNAMHTAGSDLWERAGQFLPSVSVSGSYGRTGNGPTSAQYRELGGGIVDTSPPQRVNTVRSYSTGIGLDYTLFDGLRNVWGYLGTKASKHATEYSNRIIVSNLVFGVKEKYYSALKAKRDYEVAQGAVKRSAELLKLFEEKYSLGSASLSEVLKQRVQSGNDQLTLVQTDNQYRVNLDDLALTIGVEPSDDFEVAQIELRKEEVKELPDLIREVITDHPSLLGADEALASSKYGVRLQYGEYLPTLSLSYRYGWGKNTFSEISKFGPYDHSGRLDVTLGYNIFDGFSRENRLSQARAKLSNSKASRVYVYNQLILSIRAAYLGIKLADETLKLTEDKERAAKEDMDLVQAKYGLGAAALWELLDAQVSLKTAQFDKINAEFKYSLALAQLQNALGQ